MVCAGAPSASPHPGSPPLLSAEAGAPRQFLVPAASLGHLINLIPTQRMGLVCHGF